VNAEKRALTEEILELNLGKSSVKEVLLEYGPANAAFLSGYDAEAQDVQVSDPVVFRFKRALVLRELNKCDFLVFFGDDLIAKRVAINAGAEPGSTECRILRDEIVSVFGDGYLETRHHWVMDADETEGRLSDCHDPKGAVTQWTYQDLGLVVTFFDGTDSVGSLLFYDSIPARLVSLPDCAR
jgi:hypothetical protein